MKKTFYLLAFGAALLASARLAYPRFLTIAFNLRGRLEMADSLKEAAARPNTMLFVVARNESGVPVAIKKIINPSFPLSFRLSAENLIMPELLTKFLFLEAFLNTHGELGVTRAGDIKGEIVRQVYFREKDVLLTLNTLSP